jgi:signal transduction histidine kinase
VTLTDEEGEVSLALHNRGNPIPAEDQAKIFQPYEEAGQIFIVLGEM